MNAQPESNRPESVTAVEDATIRTGNEFRWLKTPAQKIWLAFAVLVIVLAGVTYLYFGGKSGWPRSVESKAGDGPSTAVMEPTKSRKALSDEQLERMVVQAAGQTQKEPQNVSAWVMLAHSYEMLGKFAESAKAYTKLAQLLPKDAQVLADYADVLAVTNGRSFKGEPLGLLKRALAIDATNAKVLFLMGAAHIEAQDYVQAISYLEKARSATRDIGLLREIDSSIAQAMVQSGKPLVMTTPPAPEKLNAAVAGGSLAAQVSGRVWLADDLRAKVPAQATLFLFARPADGSRMPVALLRKKVSDLPMNFTLDDSMAMVPNMGLSKLSTVVVVARISLKGNVTPTAGDLEGISAPVSVGSQGLKLEISEILK